MGGRSSKAKVNSHDKAVLDLKVQRDKLKQYQKRCEQVLAKETEIARALLKEGKKKQALLALKKKKYQEQLLEKTEVQLSNVHEMIDSIEFAQMEQKVFQGLQEGNKVLQEIHQQMSLEEIDQLMQDTQEAIDYQRQVEDALSGKFTDADEEDIMSQLEQLEKECITNELAEKMPSVPEEQPQKSSQDVSMDKEENLKTTEEHSEKKYKGKRGTNAETGTESRKQPRKQAELVPA
jgi:charged multivesicular body protein 6